MKIVSSLFVLIIVSAAAAAQDTPKVIAAISSESVKNAPFSADAVSDSVQTLFDGNRIVRSSTSKLYRNSEGRIRRELEKGSGGGFSMFQNFEPMITIGDPMGGRFLLDSTTRIATTIAPLPLGQLNIVGAGKLTDEQAAAVKRLKELSITDRQNLTDEQKKELEKLHVELRPAAPRAVIAGNAVTGAISVTGMQAPIAMSLGHGESKYETKTEDLGTRDFDGVQAEGTRRVTTIPAGAIGNERPIETVYERWYSKDLQMVVMSKHSDPRFGEQTYRLTNIVRAEPDPSLFSVPSGYKVVSDHAAAGQYYYRVAAKAEAERTAAKAARATTATTKP